MSTRPIQFPPANLVGKFLAIFEPQKPRTLLHVEKVIYEITEKKGEKQVMLATAFVPPGGTDKPRTKTVLGENVAAFFGSLEAGKQFLEIVADFVRDTERNETVAWEFISSNHPATPTKVATASPTFTGTLTRARTRTPIAPVSVAAIVPAVRTRTRNPAN